MPVHKNIIKKKKKILIRFQVRAVPHKSSNSLYNVLTIIFKNETFTYKNSIDNQIKLLPVYHQIIFIIVIKKLKFNHKIKSLLRVYKTHQLWIRSIDFRINPPLVKKSKKNNANKKKKQVWTYKKSLIWIETNYSWT